MKDAHDDPGPPRVPLADALRALGTPEPPPADLEARVLAALAARDEVRPAAAGVGRPAGTAPFRAAKWLRAAAAAAAGVALFTAGALVARRDPPALAEGPRYALLLLPGPALSAATGEEEAARVERYRAWGERLAGDRRLVSAEKLGAAVALVSADGAIDAAPDEVAPALLGFFIIVADSDADALAAARASPHAQEGGRIAIVRIEPT
jgi:hypothetical protein